MFAMGSRHAYRDRDRDLRVWVNTVARRRLGPESETSIAFSCYDCKDASGSETDAVKDVGADLSFYLGRSWGSLTVVRVLRSAVSKPRLGFGPG